MTGERRLALIALGITLLAFGLRFVGLAQRPLLPDEAYYWLWSRHLDWAYYDHPAGIALLVRLSTALGGSSEFGIRWLNALLGTLCVALTIAVGRRMVTPGGGVPAGSLVAAGAPFLITARFVYTDTLFLFLMLLNLYTFLVLPAVWPATPAHGEMQRPERRAWLPYLLFGLTLALLFNTKYTAYLYAAGLGGWLLWERRASFREARLWLAVGIAAVGLLPVLSWNVMHDWGSFRWQFSHAVSSSPGATAASGWLWRWLGNTRHALAYHTWPLAAAALAGALALIRHRRSAPLRLSLWLALLVGLPPFLSPAGSPRNLTGGLLVLLLSAGAWLREPGRWRTVALGSSALLLGCTALYGWGTMVPTFPYHSSARHDIERETTGLHDLVAIVAAHPEHGLLALDYSLAGQLWYYTGRPVATGWPQYRLWETPNLTNALIFSLDYLPGDAVEAVLQAAYTTVEGPYEGAAGNRAWRWWRAEYLRQQPADLLARLDFLTLWAASR